MLLKPRTCQCLYGMRVFHAWKESIVGALMHQGKGFGCLELCLYGTREHHQHVISDLECFTLLSGWGDWR